MAGSWHASFALLSLHIIAYVLLNGTYSFLLDDPKVHCPHPATNCLDETFNRVIENLGCLGCQSGCQSGYTMMTNMRYFITGNDTVGLYNYQGINIAKSKNVSEPEWLCFAGHTCPFGYFSTKIGQADSCAYCGEGCLTCDSYEQCNDCILGYWITHGTLLAGVNTSTCTSSGVVCPEPKDGWHCKHQVYARAVVGCSGCVLCEDGYLPTSNPSYRRAPGQGTGTYDYMGLKISGSFEISESRYTCVAGNICSNGWTNVTRNGLQLCEEDSSTVR